MDVQVIAELYGGLPERVVVRAREVLRLARAKSSIHEDMKTPVACLVVACRAMEEPMDVKKLAALLQFSDRSLDQTARKIANLVNVKSTQKVTPTSLCVRHGCAAITEFVNRVYDAYQVVAQRLARGKTAGGGGVRLFDPTDPVFAAACLFACAKRAKLRIDRPKLIADTNANPRTFEAIVSSIEKQCHQELQTSSGISNARAVVRTSAAASATRRPSSPPTKGQVKSAIARTKAAQRAAVVLEKAVAEKETKTNEGQAMERMKATIQQESTTGVTVAEYEEWREHILELYADKAVLPALPTAALSPRSTPPQSPRPID